MKKEEPANTFIIRDFETLRVIADPLRKQILELLIHDTLTVKQTGDRLGLAPSKLYYHINMLEQHGLIEVVETRMVANMVEKWYKAAAADVDIAPELLSFSTQEGKENLYVEVAATIDATREDLLRSLEARTVQLEQGAQEQPRKAVINRQTVQISDQRAEEFFLRLSALMEEFEAAEATSAGEKPLQTYALTIAFYPSFYFDQPD